MFLLVMRAGCTGGTRRTGGTAVGTATAVRRRYSTGNHCSTGCRRLRSRYIATYIGYRSQRCFSCGSPVAQHRQQGNCHHFFHINSFLTFDLLKNRPELAVVSSSPQKARTRSVVLSQSYPTDKSRTAGLYLRTCKRHCQCNFPTLSNNLTENNIGLNGHHRE